MVNGQVEYDERVGSRRPPLVLAPFRGLRFDPATVGDLGSVVSPPYDVLDADLVRELEAGNQRNIVRLILSRRHERPYRAVRRRLDSWRRDGYLVPDPVPALYLYQYTADGVTVRGLVGLVGLHPEEDGVILPHEDVMPPLVEDRTVLMRTTRTNPEPILLVHRGTARLRDLLEEASARPSDADFSAADGSHHRLWLLTAQELQGAIADELAGGQALIADGHHRYAAYLALQAESRAGAGSVAGSDTGSVAGSPWDFGLAMLVDQHDYPLQIGPIHRTVAGLTLSDVLEMSAERGDQVRVCDDREEALAVLDPPDPVDDSRADRTVQFAVSDGHAWAVLTVRRPEQSTPEAPAGVPDATGNATGEPTGDDATRDAPMDVTVDAAVLHEVLLPAWNVTDAQVGYHHTVDQALHTVTRQTGVLVAVRPPSLERVMASAANGVRLPRKSTSFFPKPRMGLVLRDLRDT